MDEYSSLRRVGSRLHRSRAITQVSSDKSKCFVGLVHCVVNMLSPGKVFAEGDS